MENSLSAGKKLGILGGGQLGKMLIQAASQWDLIIHVLDPDPTCPSAHYCHQYTEGSFKDYDTVYQFGQKVDVLTIEIENVNTDALKKLKEEGKIVHPDPDVIALIKDKGLQKKFYREHKLATSDFEWYENPEALLDAVRTGALSLPFVQKKCTEGYDGRGVQVMRSEQDLEKVLPGESIAESLVDIAQEISVIVARNAQGDIICFPPVEMEFNPTANLVEMLLAPARISLEDQEKAEALARATIEKLDMVGVLAVEMFRTADGTIMINEVAPRPHNSGHQTIEANLTSQYAQHLRAVMDLPLGATDQVWPAVMINLLGAEGFTGPAIYDGVDQLMQTPGAYLHIYGKAQTKPFRKMGHITVMDRTLEAAVDKANQLKSVVRVIA